MKLLCRTCEHLCLKNELQNLSLAAQVPNKSPKCFFLYVLFFFLMFLPINQQKKHTPWGKLVVCCYACCYSHKCTVPLLTSPSLSPSPCPKRGSNIWLSTLKIHFHFDFYSCRRNWKLRFCSWRERQQILFTLFTYVSFLCIIEKRKIILNDCISRFFDLSTSHF